MVTKIVRGLSIVGCSLVLTAGLLVGCGSGDTDSTSAQTPEQQVAQQSEQDPELDHGQAESNHQDESHEGGPDHDQEYQRADHFEGKEAKTYEEAVSNMKQANSKLEDLLARDELTGEDFYKIHRMSYTMENALAKIREESDGDYQDVAEHLESVHLASEKQEAETVRQDGQQYLEGAKAMLSTE